uniref:F-box domain-containing protein n=1 Tax=Oryza punctata TaxID=4537 RepID=A0A0E0KXZ7_ORYPU
MKLTRCGGRLLADDEDAPRWLKKRRCDLHEWSDLPSELTKDIASRLLRYDVAEYLRFRAVCKAWRECTPHPRQLDSRFRPRRWILLSSDGARCRFLNIATGACAQVDLPELAAGGQIQIACRTEGLLVLRDEVTDAIRLLNPLTKAVTDLPPVTAAMASVIPEDRVNDERPSSLIVYAGISDETSPPTVALFLRGRGFNIASDLPSELTEDIASRLLRYDVAEYLRFRAVCKAWRECTPHPRQLDSRFRPRRWILLSSDGARCRFLNIATGACAQVDLPELAAGGQIQIECRTEGLLVLRDKVTDAIRLLNPLTKAVTDLPPVTAAMASVIPEDRVNDEIPSLIVYAGISDETSPPTVALFLRGRGFNIAYAKPGDNHWKLLDDKAWSTFPSQQVISHGDGKALWYVKYLSVVTHRGRIYFATYQGNILKLSIRPRPRLIPIVKDQSNHLIWNGYLLCNNVISYLVPPDDDDHLMLMVRHYDNLCHLTDDQRRCIKRRKKNDLIKLPKRKNNPDLDRYDWQMLQVFEVDISKREKKLVRVDGIADRAVFIGDVACVSLSTNRFPSIHGNTVYLGMNSRCTVGYGLCHLKDRSVEPRLEHVLGAPQY